MFEQGSKPKVVHVRFKGIPENITPGIYGSTHHVFPAVEGPVLEISFDSGKHPDDSRFPISIG